jgi:hypothetical protein
MLARRHIVRYSEAPGAEDPEEASTPLRSVAGGRRQFTLLLQLAARWDATSLLVSVHDHCPNAYIASPCTTVV